MGIQNKDGALYFATGIDNSGLYSGRREAIGIIKAMAGEITSFDVFGGIGISAGIAFAQAAKGAYDFEKQFQQSMKEVATLSSGIKGSLTDYMNQVMEITRTVPVEANEAAKALYQIVSAGHDGANGMKVLEASAKAAVGGVTDTATAADAITTVLNAYKLDASKAQEVSDQLFTTVRLGKTDFGQLGKSIAQAAPIAASFGIDIKEVLGAVASITKQGVPTSEAMTKIRAAILGTANQLGDAAFKGRTFQEALQLIYDKAGGSSTKMKELLGTDEALQAALMLTGEKAKEAASDLDEVNNSAGAAEAAFKEMASSAENQMKLLGNNITATLRPLGKEILKQISSAAQSINKAFDNGNAQESLKTIGTLIVTVTTALAGYKGSILAVSIAKQISAGATALVNKQRTIEIGRLVLSQGFYDAETGAIVKNMSTRILLTKALKAQTIAQLKNAAAMLTNPYVLAAAAFAGLGYAIYKCATAESDSERAMKKHNAAMETQKKHFDELKNKAESLVNIIKDETSSQFDKLSAYKQLQSIMPNVLKNLDLEKIKTMELHDILKLLNKDKNEQYVMGIKVRAVMKQEELDAATAEWQKAIDEAEKNRKDGIEDPGLSIRIGRLAKKKNEAAESARLAKEEVEKINEIQKKAKEEQKKEEEKAAIQNKAFWTKQKEDATKALDSIASAQKKQMDAGNFKGIDSAVVKSYKENAKKLKEAEKELKVYDSSSKQDDKAQKLREEQEKYKLLLDKQTREQERIKIDSANELEQLEINKLKESSEKVLRQRKLNHKLELQAIEREAEDKKLKVIEDARSAFEANPENKKKTFNASVFINSESTKKLFASFDNIAKEATATANTKYNRGDDLSDLLNQYQDYTDQRLAIERKFNEDIATLQEQRKQAEKDGNTEQVEQIDRSITQATKNKGMELMNLDYDKLKESPEYVRAFENLKETSSETLNSLLSQLENAKGAAAKVLSPDQLREYTTTIQEIMDELDSRNPFQSLSDKKKELAEAEEELAKAQIELENARAQAEAVKGGAMIEDGVKSSKYNPKTGKIDSTKTYLTEAQALDKVKEKTDNYNEAKDKVTKSDAKVKKSQKEVRSEIDELCNTIDDLGKSIGGPAGEIISLIGNIGSFTLMAMSGVEAAADTSANAISTVEKASVILAIISAAMQIGMKIFDLFGKDDTTEKYEKAKEAYESYISILDRVIEKQLELAETLTGDNANAAYDKALEMIKLQSANARTLGQMYLNSGASRKSHSKGYTEVEDMSTEGWKQAADTLGMSVDKFKEKMGGRMTGLFDLTDEQLAKLQENAGIFWSQLDSDTQKYADQIVDGVTQVAEVVEQKITDATLIDIDGLRSDFQDLLTDMDADSADFADNFEEYMRNAILNSMLKESYMGRLTEWRKKFYAAMDNGVTEKEYNDLKEEGQQISKDMKAERDKMAEMFGWTGSEGSSQSSTSKGYETMSQEEGKELNGRFTAFQISNEEIKNQAIIQTGIQQTILQKLEYLYNFNYSSVTEMHDMITDVLNYLDDIKKDTSHLYFIRESLDKIENNTKGLSVK